MTTPDPVPASSPTRTSSDTTAGTVRAAMSATDPRRPLLGLRRPWVSVAPGSVSRDGAVRRQPPDEPAGGPDEQRDQPEDRQRPRLHAAAEQDLAQAQPGALAARTRCRGGARCAGRRAEGDGAGRGRATGRPHRTRARDRPARRPGRRSAAAAAWRRSPDRAAEGQGERGGRRCGHGRSRRAAAGRCRAGEGAGHPFGRAEGRRGLVVDGGPVQRARAQPRRGAVRCRRPSAAPAQRRARHRPPRAVAQESPSDSLSRSVAQPAAAAVKSA